MREKIMQKETTMTAILVVVAVILMGVYTSYYQVEEYEQAVVLRMGEYLTTEGSGLHFKLPFKIDNVYIIETNKQILEFGFRKNANVKDDVFKSYYKGNSGGDDFDEESIMLTGDLNVVDVEWYVHYQITDPYKYLFNSKEPIKNIKDVSEAVMRRVVGDTTLEDALSEGRQKLTSKAQKLMQDVLSQYDIGITIEDVGFNNVLPPRLVKKWYNEVNAAKQEKEKLINQAKRNYNRVIPEARGKADKKVATAEGFASAIINRSKGDASKFSSMAREFSKAPKITRKRLYLEKIEEVYSKLGKITLVDSKIKGLLPIFQGRANNLDTLVKESK
jgi:modulator of FtsH protease HflK